MSVQFYGAISLDGYLAGPDDEMDWLTKGPDPTVDTYSPFIATIGALVMGSATYGWLRGEVDAWPYQMPSFVFTTRDLPTMDGDITFVQGDVVANHPTIQAAAKGKDIWIVGGGGLLAQYHAAGLLDELYIQTCPVAIGAGKPLFVDSLVGARLKLEGVTDMGAGFVQKHYSVA